MTSGDPSAGGDRVRVSVFVRVDVEEAFRAFTEDIDRWWRHGPKYRVAGRTPAILRLEPGVGGRLYESVETGSSRTASETSAVVQTGTVTRWDPPTHLAFEWRGVNFAPGERTLVEVVFEPRPGGTRVELTHSGWSAIRPDHPARHGLGTAAFVRMMGLWWGELLSSLRTHALARGEKGQGRQEREERTRP